MKMRWHLSSLRLIRSCLLHLPMKYSPHSQFFQADIDLKVEKSFAWLHLALNTCKEDERPICLYPALTPRSAEKQDLFNFFFLPDK